jgi:hypothetical protein
MPEGKNPRFIWLVDVENDLRELKEERLSGKSNNTEE